MSTWNETGSARRVVTTSTSMAVQPAMAASSSSTGVNSVPLPSPMPMVPPRSFVAVYLFSPVRSMDTCRRAS